MKTRQLIILVLVLSLSWIPLTRKGAASEWECSCTFSDNTYQAFGSNGACSAFSHRNDTLCEISFAGTDAKKEPGTTFYDGQTLQIVGEFFTALAKKDFDMLKDPSFLKRALLQFMRGAYLRPRTDEKTAKYFDEGAQELLDKETEKISLVFRDKEQPYSGKLTNGIEFAIERNAVILTGQGDRLIVIYIPQEQQ